MSATLFSGHRQRPQYIGSAIAAIDRALTLTDVAAPPEEQL
jgi:hypothetical protein